MVICSFYARRRAAWHKFHFDLLSISSPHGDGHLRTENPPEVGDLIFLWDEHVEDGEPHRGVFRVIERFWHYSAYGSANWPLGEEKSRVAPSLDIIVEQTTGLFRDEAEATDDDRGD